MTEPQPPAEPTPVPPPEPEAPAAPPPEAPAASASEAPAPPEADEVTEPVALDADAVAELMAADPVPDATDAAPADELAAPPPAPDAAPAQPTMPPSSPPPAAPPPAAAAAVPVVTTTPPAPVASAPAPVAAAPVAAAASPKKRSATSTISRIVAFLFGILQALLVLRIVLLLLIANQDNAIVSWVLSVTDPFVEPFRGVFKLDEIEGQRGAVLDVAAVVAIIAWSLIETLILSVLRLIGRRD